MIPDNKGFTMIEILIVMALIAIISGIAYNSYTKSLPNKHLKQAATQLFLDLQRAKSLAVLNRVNMTINFDSENQQYSIMDQNGTIIKTVPLSDYKSGITFGRGPATTPKGDSFGTDFISFPNATVRFRPNGVATSLGGYAYLTNVKGSLCYAVGVTGLSGMIRIFKTASGSWPND